MNFSSKNNLRFQILLVLLVLIFLPVILMNFYVTISTVFSGTGYAPLPSNFYVQNNIECLKHLKSRNEHIFINDTLQAGSFILSIGDISCKNIHTLDSCLMNFKTSDSILIKALNYKVFQHIKKEEQNINYESLVSVYKIEKKKLNTLTILELNNGIFIHFVVENGATDRAGIKSGDVLFSIGGKQLAFEQLPEKYGLTRESLKHLRSHQSGEFVEFEILRQNEYQTVNVCLASYGIQFSFLYIFLTGFVYIAVGLYFGLMRPNLKAARYTGLTLVTLGITFASSLGVNPYDYDLLSKLVYLTNITAFFFCIPLCFHSLLYFPKELYPASRNKFLKILNYSLAAVGTIIADLAIFTNYPVFKGILSSIIFIILVLFNIIMLILYRKSHSNEVKRTMRFITISYLINLFFILFVQIFYRFFDYTSVPWVAEIFNNAYLLLILIPISYIYTTWRYRLLDIEINIKRNKLYNFATISWKIVVIVAIATFIVALSHIRIDLPNIHFDGTNIEVLGTPLNEDLRGFYEKVIIIVTSIIISVFIWAAGNKGQRLIDKNFYRIKFDYHLASKQISELTGRGTSTDNLAEEIVKKLGSLVHLKKVGLAIFKNETEITTLKIYSENKGNNFDFPIDLEHTFIKAMEQFSGGIIIDYLPDKIRQIFKIEKFFYVVPIRLKSKLLGCLLIGEKLSETVLQNEDFEFLASISNQISISIENSFLYEELSQRERIKHELDLARKIQTASLPQFVPDIEGLDIAGLSIPAYEVGGDFYDYLTNSSSDLTIILGDVSGKGTSAALYMSKIQGIIRILHNYSTSPKDLLIKSNEQLKYNLDKGAFITAVCAHFDSKNQIAKVTRAGHLPLLYFSKIRNSFEIVTPKGIGLGMGKVKEFANYLEEQTILFNSGDIFIFISDGVVDSRNDSKVDFGQEKLIDNIKFCIDSNAAEIRDNIIKSIKLHTQHTEQYDDLTIVIVKVK